MAGANMTTSTPRLDINVAGYPKTARKEPVPKSQMTSEPDVKLDAGDSSVPSEDQYHSDSHVSENMADESSINVDTDQTEGFYNGKDNDEHDQDGASHLMAGMPTLPVGASVPAPFRSAGPSGPGVRSVRVASLSSLPPAPTMPAHAYSGRKLKIGRIPIDVPWGEVTLKSKSNMSEMMTFLKQSGYSRPVYATWDATNTAKQVHAQQVVNEAACIRATQAAAAATGPGITVNTSGVKRECTMSEGGDEDKKHMKKPKIPRVKMDPTIAAGMLLKMVKFNAKKDLKEEIMEVAGENNGKGNGVKSAMLKVSLDGQEESDATEEGEPDDENEGEQSDSEEHLDPQEDKMWDDYELSSARIVLDSDKKPTMDIATQLLVRDVLRHKGKARKLKQACITKKARRAAGKDARRAWNKLRTKLRKIMGEGASKVDAEALMQRVLGSDADGQVN
ncbi:hypothetical protein CC78DRAFT_607837 [Lojkania enalia]|uniref:Uncharacterized protein n=1 Tax=Lojkania enalia TaxID=147567 RepID=A0A9P4KGF3_9PLEO|nr:hypothetical protein CC78DRAFT_607837 [Didymosphaeria enalia]